MKAVEILRIGKELLKVMSTFDLRRDDYLHIELYEEYLKMRVKGDKIEYILCFLANKYKLSESTIKRVIRRFSKEVKL